MSKRGWSAWTVLVSRSRSLGASQAERRGSDHLDRQRLEVDIRRRADPLQAPAQHGQGVFGGKKEHGTGAPDHKAAQTGSP